ncbi:MAG: enolase C-terminal domain-like protein, partial [Chloroflexota bacterium]
AMAVPYLQALQEQPHVAIVETPIPQGDVAGNQEIRSKTRVPIAMHFGTPPFLTAIRENVCHGFVVGGGARGVLRQAALAAEANRPFWLQLMGTGLTTAWSLHLGAVCSHAQWPGVTIMNAYADDLLSEPLAVRDGFVPVPQAPGLGVQVDQDALERLRFSDDATPPRRRQVSIVTWPTEAHASGAGPTGSRRTTYTGDEERLRQDFDLGNERRFVPGVAMEVVEDDGSARFDALYRQASQAPLRDPTL